MSEFFLESSMAGVVVSLLSYYVGTVINRKWKLAILNPLLIAIVFVTGFLLLFQVDYDTYNNSAKYLSDLLTPATVSLAIPLYRQMELLKENAAAIIAGIFSGVLTSLCSILVLAELFHLSHEEYVTLLPKSITTAIGLAVSEELGGYAVITVAGIILTGLLGNIAAETLCRIFRIKYPVSKGLAIGTTSHAMGTAKAMEMGEIEGAMSSLAIVVSGLCTVAGAAVFAEFL